MFIFYYHCVGQTVLRSATKDVENTSTDSDEENVDTNVSLEITQEQVTPTIQPTTSRVTTDEPVETITSPISNITTVSGSMDNNQLYLMLKGLIDQQSQELKTDINNKIDEQSHSINTIKTDINNKIDQQSKKMDEQAQNINTIKTDINTSISNLSTEFSNKLTETTKENKLALSQFKVDINTRLKEQEKSIEQKLIKQDEQLTKQINDLDINFNNRLTVIESGLTEKVSNLEAIYDKEITDLRQRTIDQEVVNVAVQENIGTKVEQRLKSFEASISNDLGDKIKNKIDETTTIFHDKLNRNSQDIAVLSLNTQTIKDRLDLEVDKKMKQLTEMLAKTKIPTTQTFRTNLGNTSNIGLFRDLGTDIRQFTGNEKFPLMGLDRIKTYLSLICENYESEGLWPYVRRFISSLMTNFAHDWFEMSKDQFSNFQEFEVGFKKVFWTPEKRFTTIKNLRESRYQDQNKLNEKEYFLKKIKIFKHCFPEMT